MSPKRHPPAPPAASRSSTPKRKGRTGKGWLFLLLLIAGGLAFLFWENRSGGEADKVADNHSATSAPEAAPAAQAPENEPPAIRYPIDEAGSENIPRKALPEIDQSDNILQESLSDAVRDESLLGLFRNERIVRNLVVTIDNLPRPKVADRLLPVKPAAGRLSTSKVEGGIAIAQANSGRYAPYVALLEAIDSKKLVAEYKGLYPLFQRAYEELGYPDAYFNDRLVQVIDHMLEAPEPEGPVLLKQPHILYQFADPALEASSSGHKLMIRIGKENAQRVKKKLAEIRKLLTERQPS